MKQLIFLGIFMVARVSLGTKMNLSSLYVRNINDICLTEFN